MSPTNNQFGLKLPDGWEDQSSYTFTGPELNGVNHVINLFIDRDLPDTDLVEFAQDRIAPLKSGMPSLETLKEETRTLPNGFAAYEWVYKMALPNQQVAFKKHVYLIVDGIGYTFLGNFSKQSMKTIGLEMDQIIASMVPIKQ